MALERGLNDSALHAAAASMNQPHFTQSCVGGGVDVIGHHVWNIARRECVKIQLRFDGQVKGVFCHCRCRSGSLP
jgi:hypothetical protein